MITVGNGFIKIRRGLHEHLLHGDMTGKELSVYMAIHFYADYNTGLAAKVSAPFLANYLSEKTHIVKDVLRSLAKKGYIKRFNFRGQRTYYPILINRFETPIGLIIRADKSLSLDKIVLESSLKGTLNQLYSFRKPSANLPQTFSIKEVKMLRLREDKKLRIDGTSEDKVLELYNIYPKKKARDKALKAIRKALKDNKFETIKEGLLRYIDERKGKDPKYTKHPATWFNGECWNDEPEIQGVDIDAIELD